MSSFILAREICFQATWENGAPVLKYKNAAKQDVYNVNIVCASQLLASIIAICVRCIEALPLLSTYNQAQCRIVLGSCACKDRLEHCIFCSDLCSLCRASRVVQPCSTTFGCCDTRSVARVVHALQRSGPSLSSRVGDGWVSFRPTFLGSISRWEGISCRSTDVETTPDSHGESIGSARHITDGSGGRFATSGAKRQPR